MIIFKSSLVGPAFTLPAPALDRARQSFLSEGKLRMESAGVLRGKHTGHQSAVLHQFTPQKSSPLFPRNRNTHLTIQEKAGGGLEKPGMVGGVSARGRSGVR